MPKRVGRPMVERSPNERVPLATRVRGSIYNKLIEAALANDRPLGNEVEMRLEASFAPPHPLVPKEHVATALLLLGRYLQGEPAVVSGLLDEPGTDEEKFWRLHGMMSALLSWEAQNAHWLQQVKQRLEAQEAKP